MRLGLTPPIEVAGFPASVELCARAEGLGYTDAWTAEAGGPDGFSPLAAVAVRTEQIRLGTALVPVFTRPPALTAMSAAALQSLSGGRFVLGVGASSPAIVGGWMGLEYARPLQRCREYVEVLRDLLAGKKVTYAGETLRVEGFRLQADTSMPVPIYLGALGPRMCRLAGRIADGVQLFLKTPDGVRQALRDVAAGAREAGRDPAGLDVVIRLPLVVDEAPDVVRFMGRRLLTGYATVPAYNASLARQGFEDEASAMAEAWTAGERGRAVDLFPDALFDQLFLSGDAEACRARIEAFREAGVTTPVVMPLSFAGTQEERTARVEAAVESLAPR